MSTDKNLDRLREITPNLPRVPSLADIMTRGTGLRHAFKTIAGGPILEQIVWSENDVAIGLDEAKAGTKVAEHEHANEVEVYVVVEGAVACHINRDGKTSTQTATRGQIIVIPAGCPHICTAVEDLRMVVITVPAAEGMRQG